MNPRLVILAVLSVAAAIGVSLFKAADEVNLDRPDNTLVMTTKHGAVHIQLRPDLAPAHVRRLKTLTKDGFYNGLTFHRVIRDFMAQTGDPTATGNGGSRLGTLKPEFSNEPFVRGTVGMARKKALDSANSQFFIMFKPNDKLNGKYTIVGRVVRGMDVVDKIKLGHPTTGQVMQPDRIQKMQLASEM